MALLVLLDQVNTALEKNEFTVGIFLDFSKAFDTVNHSILLQKLEYYGVRGIANKWVGNYLDNRTQSTTYNGATSQPKLCCVEYHKAPS